MHLIFITINLMLMQMISYMQVLMMTEYVRTSSITVNVIGGKTIDQDIELLKKSTRNITGNISKN